MTPRPTWPIRWWLATFGAAVALPFIVVLTVMFVSEIRSERLAARRTAFRVAQAAADRLTGLRADSLALLRHMALRPGIQHFDSEPCDSLFAIVDFFPQYVNLFLFDRSGHLICAASPDNARDRRLSAAAQHWLETALALGHPDSERLIIRESAGEWVSTLTLPIRSASGATGTLAVVALPEIVAKEALPAGAVVTVLDRSGTILARSADSPMWAGRNTRGSEVTRLILEQGEGTAESTGVDGVARQYGFTFIRELNWYIYVGVPTSVIMEPLRTLYVRGMQFGILVILIAVIVAMLLSRTVERPINELAEVAGSIARGAYRKVGALRRSPQEIATLATAFNYMVDMRSRAEEQMEEGERRLKALSERLLTIQEEERTRIAREIHDDLGQSLTALKMDVLGLLERSGVSASPARDRIQRTLDSAVTAVQRIAAELRPSMLDDLGLVPALEAEVRVFEERTGIECEASLPRDQLPLEGVALTVLYRIVQEALTNVMRHSNASRVEIRLRVLGDKVFLEIRDDGRGITEDEVTSQTSLGLLGIRERAAMIGATAAFEGVAGRGTIVSVRIPVAARSRAVS